MESIAVTVSEGGYPIFIKITQGNQTIDLTHEELHGMEFAIAEAKRQVLCQLDKRDWHEVDAKLAGA